MQPTRRLIDCSTHRDYKGASLSPSSPMPTVEALHDSEADIHQASQADTWPEDLPADAMELARELDKLQRPHYEPGKGLGPSSPVPAEIEATEAEVRKLLFASGPFPQAIAQDLAADMRKLRQFHRAGA